MRSTEIFKDHFQLNSIRLSFSPPSIYSLSLLEAPNHIGGHGEHNTISTYQLITFITVEVCFLCWMFGTEQCLLERRNQGGHISSQCIQVNDFVGEVFFPLLVGLYAALTYKPTSAAEASCLTFLTLIAHCLVAGAHLLEGILDVKEIVDVEGSLEPRDSTCWQFYVLATVWACKALFLMYHRLQALLTKDVETLEFLVVCRAPDISHR